MIRDRDNETDLQQYERLSKYLATLSKKVEALRKKLAKTCKHPPEICEPYRWEHDNGYGEQTKNVGTRCKLCYAIDLWNTGRFSLPEWAR